MSKQSVIAEVFRSLTGEFHPCLMNRRGVLLWQGSSLPTYSQALLIAQAQLIARKLRLVGSSPIQLGGAP